jgi:hypothetical protein
MRFLGGVRGSAWRGFAFDPGTSGVSEHIFNSLVGGAGAGAASLRRPRARRRFTRGGIQPSSEAEIRPRGRPALERGGDSPEGASSPRARRRFARGGVQPSSEAEIRPRGRPALERGGSLPEGASA